MTRILITRPEPQALRTAEHFRAAGFTVLSAPMLEVAFQPGAARDLSVALSAGQPQALLITSQHAAEVLRDVPEAAGHTVLAVGPASADAARDAGAKNVTQAGGDANSLLALVRERCSPKGGPLIYLRAADIAADLAGMLRSDGYEIVEILTYEARPVQRIPDEAAQALLAGQIDGVLFYSARTAEIFVGIAAGQGLMPALSEVRGVAISETVAQMLRQSGWKRVCTVRLSDAETSPALLSQLFDAPLPEPAAPQVRPMPEAGVSEEPVRARRPLWRRLRWEMWLIAGAGLIGLLATAHYFYGRSTGLAAFRSERPSEHRFLTRSTMPHIASAPIAAREASEETPPPAADTPAAATVVLPPAASGETTKRIAALQQQLDEQAARLEALEQQASADREALAVESGKRVALGKLVALKARMLTGEPYSDELSDLLLDEGAREVESELGKLAPAATSGLATPESLRESFDAALAANAVQPSRPGIWNGVKARLSRLVTIRKIGADQTGQDDGAILARSDAALASGDLQGALDETALLSPRAAPAFAGFREALKTRLRLLGLVDAATERLSAAESDAR